MHNGELLVGCGGVAWRMSRMGGVPVDGAERSELGLTDVSALRCIASHAIADL